MPISSCRRFFGDITALRISITTLTVKTPPPIPVRSPVEHVVVRRERQIPQLAGDAQNGHDKPDHKGRPPVNSHIIRRFAFHINLSYLLMALSVTSLCRT